MDTFLAPFEGLWATIFGEFRVSEPQLQSSSTKKWIAPNSAVASGQKNAKKLARRDPKIGGKSDPKTVPKSMAKSERQKPLFLEFAMKFDDSIVIYKSEWAWDADSIVFSNEFSLPERLENDGQCG